MLFEVDRDGVPYKFGYQSLQYEHGALFGSSEEEKQYNAHLYLLVSIAIFNCADQ